MKETLDSEAFEVGYRIGGSGVSKRSTVSRSKMSDWDLACGEGCWPAVAENVVTPLTDVLSRVEGLVETIAPNELGKLDELSNCSIMKICSSGWLRCSISRTKSNSIDDQKVSSAADEPSSERSSHSVTTCCRNSR